MGEGECDVLQTLYDGSVESNIYAGWRDNMADKSGYLVMYLAEGYIVQQACGGGGSNEEIIPYIPPSIDNSTDEYNETDSESSSQEEDSL